MYRKARDIQSLISRNATAKYRERNLGVILRACFSLSDCDEFMAARRAAVIPGDVQCRS